MALVRGLCSVTGERTAEKATISHEKSESNRDRRTPFRAFWVDFRACTSTFWLEALPRTVGPQGWAWPKLG